MEGRGGARKKIYRRRKVNCHYGEARAQWEVTKIKNAALAGPRSVMNQNSRETLLEPWKQKRKTEN